MPMSARRCQQRMQTAMQTAARGDARPCDHRSAVLGKRDRGAWNRGDESSGIARESEPRTWGSSRERIKRGTGPMRSTIEPQGLGDRPPAPFHHHVTIAAHSTR